MSIQSGFNQISEQIIRAGIGRTAVQSVDLLKKYEEQANLRSENFKKLTSEQQAKIAELGKKVSEMKNHSISPLISSKDIRASDVEDVGVTKKEERAYKKAVREAAQLHNVKGKIK